MHARIKELVEQAGGAETVSGGYICFDQAELKKFSELLIRECATIAAHEASKAGFAILEHFEVNNEHSY